MPAEFTPASWIPALLAALCIGLAKSGLGGFGTAAVVLMAMALPARESTGAVLPLLLLADLFAVRAFHFHARALILLQLLPPALAGILCGAWLMPRIPPQAFAPVIGAVVLVMCLLQLRRRLSPKTASGQVAGRPVPALVIGWISGVATMLANAAGPVSSLYLLARGVPKMELVGTSAIFFLVVNAAKIPFSSALGLITPESLFLNLCLAPVVLAGFLAGERILRALPQRLFEDILLAFALAASLKMLSL